MTLKQCIFWLNELILCAQINIYLWAEYYCDKLKVGIKGHTLMTSRNFFITFNTPYGCAKKRVDSHNHNSHHSILYTASPKASFMDEPNFLEWVGFIKCSPCTAMSQKNSQDFLFVAFEINILQKKNSLFNIFLSRWIDVMLFKIFWNKNFGY